MSGVCGTTIVSGIRTRSRVGAYLDGLGKGRRRCDPKEQRLRAVSNSDSWHNREKVSKKNSSSVVECLLPCSITVCTVKSSCIRLVVIV